MELQRPVILREATSSRRRWSYRSVVAYSSQGMPVVLMYPYWIEEEPSYRPVHWSALMFFFPPTAKP